MKRLLLLRHAKAVRDASGDDQARALSPRGRADAILMGHLIAHKGWVPKRVLCSSATRTRETLELMLSEWKSRPTVEDAPDLYLVSWGAMLERVRSLGVEKGPVMLVGHNPGIEQLALALALQPTDAAARGYAEQLARKYPTAALAVIDFAVKDWAAIGPGTGTLSEFITPKMLKEGP